MQQKFGSTSQPEAWNLKFLLAVSSSVIIGMIIWRIDSQPNWDDSGITAAMLLAASGVISFIYPGKPLLFAITTAIWIPLVGILVDNNFGTLLAVVFGLVGSFAGSILRTKIQNGQG